MVAISTNDLKNGMTLDLQGDLLQVVEFQHVKPGKGHAFVRTTLKNARTGAVSDRTFRAGEKVERAIVDKRAMQFLYRDSSDFIFMDNESYEQVHVGETAVGEATNYMKEGDTVHLHIYKEETVELQLPASVELEITQTEPGIQGDRVSGATKPATTETGLVVQVPLFIDEGERIKVDTRDGSYLGRA